MELLFLRTMMFSSTEKEGYRVDIELWFADPCAKRTDGQGNLW